MFHTEDRKKIEGVIDQLKKYSLHHQRHKVKYISICLIDILKIDNQIKVLQDKFPSIISIIDSIDAQAAEEFYSYMYNLTERIVQSLKLEDGLIDDLNTTLKKNPYEEKHIKDTKEGAEMYENIEQNYADSISKKIKHLIDVLIKAEKIDKRKMLNPIIDNLEDILKHLAKIEKYISYEKDKIGKAKKPVRV